MLPVKSGGRTEPPDFDKALKKATSEEQELLFRSLQKASDPSSLQKTSKRDQDMWAEFNSLPAGEQKDAMKRILSSGSL